MSIWWRRQGRRKARPGLGVPAGRCLDGAAGREAGTEERAESGLTTFLTVSMVDKGLAVDMMRVDTQCRTTWHWDKCFLTCCKFLVNKEPERESTTDLDGLWVVMVR